MVVTTLRTTEQQQQQHRHHHHHQCCRHEHCRRTFSLQLYSLDENNDNDTTKLSSTFQMKQGIDNQQQKITGSHQQVTDRSIISENISPSFTLIFDQKNIVNRRDAGWMTWSRVSTTILASLFASTNPMVATAATGSTDSSLVVSTSSDDNNNWQRQLQGSLQPATTDMPQIQFPQQQQQAQRRFSSSSSVESGVPSPTVVEGTIDEQHD
jgi:hypothetical protein